MHSSTLQCFDKIPWGSSLFQLYKNVQKIKHHGKNICPADHLYQRRLEHTVEAYSIEKCFLKTGAMQRASLPSEHFKMKNGRKVCGEYWTTRHHAKQHTHYDKKRGGCDLESIDFNSHFNKMRKKMVASRGENKVLLFYQTGHFEFAYSFLPSPSVSTPKAGEKEHWFKRVINKGIKGFI